MEKKFKWHEFDISHLLPSSWEIDIKRFTTGNVKQVFLRPTSVTSREIERNKKIKSLVVDGKIIKKKLPWLYDLYRGLFYEIGQKCSTENIFVALNPLYAININVQRGFGMRYECHVDSNPLQGLLYVTTHPKSAGGELVISNKENSIGEKQIEDNSVKIYPEKGHLVFFDARKNPHFVKPLINTKGERIVVAMNFYTPSSPENNRPQDLNTHLFGGRK